MYFDTKLSLTLFSSLCWICAHVAFSFLAAYALLRKNGLFLLYSRKKSNNKKMKVLFVQSECEIVWNVCNTLCEHSPLLAVCIQCGSRIIIKNRCSVHARAVWHWIRRNCWNSVGGWQMSVSTQAGNKCAECGTYCGGPECRNGTR